MVDSQLLITTELETFCFDLPTDVGINVKYKTYSIMKHGTFS